MARCLKKKKLNRPRPTAEWGYVGMNSGYQLGCKTLLYSLILSMQSLRPLLPIVGNFLFSVDNTKAFTLCGSACLPFDPSQLVVLHLSLSYSLYE